MNYSFYCYFDFRSALRGRVLYAIHYNIHSKGYERKHKKGQRKKNAVLDFFIDPKLSVIRQPVSHSQCRQEKYAQHYGQTYIDNKQRLCPAYFDSVIYKRKIGIDTEQFTYGCENHQQIYCGNCKQESVIQFNSLQCPSSALFDPLGQKRYI